MSPGKAGGERGARASGDDDPGPGDTAAVDGDIPETTCIVGRTFLVPAQRLLAEVVETADGIGGVGQISRVAGIGPRGAKAAAEMARDLGVNVVSSWVGGSAEAPAPSEARPN